MKAAGIELGGKNHPVQAILGYCSPIFSRCSDQQSAIWPQWYC